MTTVELLKWAHFIVETAFWFYVGVTYPYPKRPKDR
jgi:hypothetical protein